MFICWVFSLQLLSQLCWPFVVIVILGTWTSWNHGGNLNQERKVTWWDGAHKLFVFMCRWLFSNVVIRSVLRFDGFLATNSQKTKWIDKYEFVDATNCLICCGWLFVGLSFVIMYVLSNEWICFWNVCLLICVNVCAYYLCLERSVCVSVCVYERDREKVRKWEIGLTITIR